MTKEELFDLKIDNYDESIAHLVKEHWNNVAKPLDGMGKFESIICRIGAVQKDVQPQVRPRCLVIMCADNGIVEEGVSQSGQEVTLAVARNMAKHRSSVCRMAGMADTDIIPVDIGINSGEKIPGVLDKKIRRGSRNFLREPAMTEEETLQAIETGIRIVRECKEKGYRILATGEMGIGNTTTSAAVTAAILGLDPDKIAGRGAGLDNKGLKRKKEVISSALQKYNFHGDDPAAAFEVLRCVGGFDIAGLCGIFIGGALYRIPVVIDGLISAAAAVCAQRIINGANRSMIASHVGGEPAIHSLLKELGLRAVIHADMALGEGTGAVMLFPLLDMALEIYRESSSFADIGMENYERFDQ